MKAGDVVVLKTGEKVRLKSRVWAGEGASSGWWAELQDQDGSWSEDARDMTHVDEEDVLEEVSARKLGTAELLDRAVTVLKKLEPSLNAKKSKPCGGCGHERFEDWDDAQLHEAVKGSIEKLTRWSDKYKRKV